MTAAWSIQNEAFDSSLVSRRYLACFNDIDEARCIVFRASDLVLREFHKLSGEFTAIGLGRATLPVEDIFTVDLCKDRKVE